MGYDNEFITGISSNPHEWNDEQANAMFLANTFAQSGSDSLLNLIGKGDMEARQNAYYKFHHTDPDDATRNRVNKLMPSMQSNVVNEQGNEAFNY